ncbi:hypothetical protein ABG807_04135 [Streptococcus iniae]
MKYQGVGRDRRDFEINVDNSNDVSRTIDSTDVKTVIEPKGTEGLLLGNTGKTWKNDQSTS